MHDKSDAFRRVIRELLKKESWLRVGLTVAITGVSREVFRGGV
jgi:hypothetical protein